jgi:hypothetical protein
LALAGAYVSKFLRRQRLRIGMRLHAEDKEYRPMGACGLRKRAWIGMRLHAVGKSMDWMCGALSTKREDRYALTRLSIPEDKDKG